VSTLSLILAPNDLDGVRDVLRDWSAVGLVDQFVWTNGAMATVVSTGTATRLLLRDVLSGASESTVVMAVLGAAVEGVRPLAPDVVNGCESLVEKSLGLGMSMIRVSATAVLKDSEASIATLATAGWHNVILAAEQGSVPERGRVVLDEKTSHDDFLVHIAASLAGVLGLWVGVKSSMFGITPAPQSATASITRSFVRSLNSSKVEADLSAAVLTTTAGLPLPRVSGGAQYIEDVALATATMQESYWRAFGWALRGPREQHERARVKGVGVFETLGMFFGFLGAAIRNAPRAWLTATIRKIKAGTASRIQDSVFGSGNSAYVVVVGGVLPDGRPASWQDIGEAVDELAAGSGASHSAHEDLTQLWQGYAAAALTLCDAGERNAGLPPVEIGARKGVLRRREDAVPGRNDRFTDVPAHLAAIVGSPDIAPYDVLEADDLEQRLAAQASQPGSGVAASTSLDMLRRWRRQFSASFSVRVGTRIAQALTSVRTEVAQILERLRDYSDDELDERMARSQRKLALVLRILFIVLIVLVAIVGLLLVLSVFGIPLALNLVAGLVFSWLLSSFIVFLRGQSAVFRLIKERRELISQQEIDRRNLHQGLRDARRLVDAYTQFLRWSEVLGAVLADPFRASGHKGLSNVNHVTGLPLAVVVGETESDPIEVDIVSAELRGLAFEPGWLNPVFGAVVANAHRRLGGRGIEFRENPELLFRQLGEGEHSVLPDLAAHIERLGVDREVGEKKWEESLGLLVEQPELSDRLLQRVRVGGRVITYTEFVGALERPASTSDQVIEDSSLRDEVRIQAGKTAVAVSEPVTVTTGLSRLTLLRQRTLGIPAYEFAAHGLPDGGPEVGNWRNASDAPVL